MRRGRKTNGCIKNAASNRAWVERKKTRNNTREHQILQRIWRSDCLVRRRAEERLTEKNQTEIKNLADSLKLAQKA